jgi:hypothetical protein
MRPCRRALVVLADMTHGCLTSISPQLYFRRWHLAPDYPRLPTPPTGRLRMHVAAVPLIQPCAGVCSSEAT